MGNDKLPETLRALSLNTEGLIKLLGKSEDERLRYWEIKKGITSVAHLAQVERVLEGMNLQLQAAIRTVEAIDLAAKEAGHKA